MSRLYCSDCGRPVGTLYKDRRQLLVCEYCLETANAEYLRVGEAAPVGARAGPAGG